MKYLVRSILPLYILFLVTVALPEDNVEDTAAVMDEPVELKLDIKIADVVDENEPIGIDSTFKNDVGSLCCWSKVISERPYKLKIYHIWNYQGEEQSRDSVNVNASPKGFRAYTAHKILPEQTGDWTVYIIDTNYNVLGMSKFNIVDSQN
ncbi:MAG: DUF2914 domain-containing protein [candidate division Zixibacteria bacterium]|nr:DUF2914 domain-containing protein [candidate division Zixibacteria bacterium]NIR62887.1 DUF2914 domain-containing protein [candidate division Zixibacteria bacterium]NIS15995.1 DUF2914 domain-containing protein [candidate division Zixibacteria bacterium]NIS44902.1 DUF2914 domain-containing protein [candidate division Zixibacteria bacterium]NIT52404.1 DUF2914 domain-containing protein [candidate division Zixibacteria bacterium]